MTEMELYRKINCVASQVSNRRRKLQRKDYTSEERAVAWADYDSKVLELDALRAVRRKAA